MMINKNIKLVLIVFLAFVISFTSLYFMDESLKIEIQAAEFNNKEKNLDEEENRIFLFGSSRMMGLDAAFIDYLALLEGKQVNVYNHGLSNDIPSRRLTVLDLSIVENPDVVFIGVDLYMFTGSQKSQISSENFPSHLSACSGKLPGVQDFYSILKPSKEFLGLDLSNFNNPKLTTLKLIDTKLNPEKYSEANKERSKQLPFSFKNESANTFQDIEDMPSDFEWSLESLTDKQAWHFDNPKYWNIGDKRAIEADIQKSGFLEALPKMSIEHNGYEANALIQIIEKLQENNIKVVIFSTPLYKTLYQAAYPCLIDDFEIFLDGFSKNYDVPIYHFHDKYMDLDIWRDRNHIIYGQTIYSVNIAEIILQEIN